MKTLDWVRRINYCGDAVGGAEELISLDSDELIDIAKRTTNLSDFGDDDFSIDYFTDQKKVIDELVDAPLLKRILIKTSILVSLRNRLFITEKMKCFPAIIDEKIKNPLFITGLPRTGSTILFELISQHENMRSPLGFEAASPVDPISNKTTGKISRNEIGQCMFDIGIDIQPEIKAIHEIRADIPIECCHIISCILGRLPGYFDDGEYQDRVEKIDSSHNFKWHKKVLQILQYGNRPKMWLLKCISHLSFLNELLMNYPDANIIHTHRDPISVFPSLLSLFENFGRNFAITPDTERTESLLLFMEGALRKSIGQRIDGTVPSSQITDIHFHDLMTNPTETIKQAFQTLDIDFSEDFSKKILQYLSGRPREKYGKHHYSIEDFGLTNREIRERFRFYTDHYNIKLEG